MNTTNNTILITGGSAGIGFEFAKALSANNKIIITGRNEARLKAALDKLPNATGILGDVANEKDVANLVAILHKDYRDLNIVINNAGKSAPVYHLATETDAFTKASEEMLTNYLSVIRLNERLLPLLKKQKEAAIVNVSSIVAIAPGGRLPSYSASKAALHSYTITLRQHLANTSVKVFEIYPPLVATEFSAEIGGLVNGIAPSVVANDLVKGLEENNFDIRVGQTADVYQLYLSNPAQAIAALSGAEA
ncbi:MAG TPA: SDR family NAD(P)-dependent oxidoreductase [Puia sp.]|uniref:SDR family oxidoreductase n=1 Tax=Puia sp. TaxID=2045100 RepID=UPI002CEF1C5B|nr:SDR family NAD(P)-dependent oxidoreductase [Puia sp.]HVU98095.1 SDR family NAD(P)-dependent oxidoreductase [Puia sp.]